MSERRARCPPRAAGFLDASRIGGRHPSGRSPYQGGPVYQPLGGSALSFLYAACCPSPPTFAAIQRIGAPEGTNPGALVLVAEVDAGPTSRAPPSVLTMQSRWS